MVSLKRDLLTIVNDLLNELDGDRVDSITDTVESNALATTVANVYFDLISSRVIPEHYELFRLEASSPDTNAHMRIPDTIGLIKRLWYDKSDDAAVEYRELRWCDPIAFLELTQTRDSTASTVDTVSDVNASTELLIYNDKMPQWFTSFDDENIVVDSYDSAVDASGIDFNKSRAWGVKIPTVTIADATVLDVDADVYPLLFNESLSRANINQHKTEHPKAEQWARRHKNFLQANKYRVEQPLRRVGYGRT